MPEKRRDNKGRILQKGESQRKDGRYQYRFTDRKGVRQIVYAVTLNELRAKEKEIQKEIEAGLSYNSGQLTVGELIDKYLKLKGNVRVRTMQSYIGAANAIKKTFLADMPLRDVKTSTVKEWVKELYDGGIKYGTIAVYRNVLRPAFQMAYEEDIILKNPFDFPLHTIIKNNGEKREALTEEQQKSLLWFVKRDDSLYKYYDELILFLHTGARVSEICGLTLDNLDFENRIIKFEKQLFCDNSGKYYTSELKTKAGYRKMPMTDVLYSSLKNIVNNRRCPNEMIVDGFGGFLLIGNQGTPRVAYHYEMILQTIVKKYNKYHSNNPLPSITPHILRHTFCTNLINSGVDAKSAQYLMGHASVKTTLDIYSHNEYSEVLNRLNNTILFEKTANLV